MKLSERKLQQAGELLLHYLQLAGIRMNGDMRSEVADIPRLIADAVELRGKGM